MSFNDVFKSSFLQNVTAVSFVDVIIGMIFACVLGAFIFWIYKLTFQGVMYSSGFGITLIGLTMVTTLVILAVTSNVVLSLGMVGALSIVRFRAAIKEPFEIVFLFWALSCGIVIGAGMFMLAIVGSIVIGAILFVFARRKIGVHPYILVVNCDEGEAEEAVLKKLETAVDRAVVKAKTVNPAGIELSIEVTLKNGDTTFVTPLFQIDGVSNASLVTYNGQFAD